MKIEDLPYVENGYFFHYFDSSLINFYVHVSKKNMNKGTDKVSPTSFVVLKVSLSETQMIQCSILAYVDRGEVVVR